MTKIYYCDSGSIETNCYRDLPLKEVKQMVAQAIAEHRIIKELTENKRIFTPDKVAEHHIIRVLPIVGGG